MQRVKWSETVVGSCGTAVVKDVELTPTSENSKPVRLPVYALWLTEKLTRNYHKGQSLFSVLRLCFEEFCKP